MKKISRFILVFVFLCIIFFLGIINMINSDSSNILFFENRKTNPLPELTREELFEGRYFTDIENYISDNFINRTELLKLDTYLNKDVLKRPEVNGIIKKNGRLINDVEKFGYDYSYEKAIQKAGQYASLSKKLSEKNVKFIYVAIPNNPSIFKDYYSNIFANYRKNWEEIDEVFLSALKKNSVNLVDMKPYLKEKRDDYFFRTDHHYSYMGAYETYKRIIENINSLGSYNLKYDKIKFRKMDTPFKGSYMQKIFNMDEISDDTIIYDIDFDYEKNDYRSKTKSRIFEFSNKGDRNYYNYGIYMGGDISITQVRTNRDNLPNIMVYGDSFTNALETFLIGNANNFVSLDFRYLKEGKNITDYVEEFKPDIVICVRDSNVYLMDEENGITQ